MTLPWKIAWKNIGRNRRRNLATGTAIAFGYAGLMLLGGYILRVEHYLRVNSIYIGHAGHVAIYKKDGLERFLTQPSRYLITAPELARLENLLKDEPQVEFLGRYLQGMGLVGNGCRTLPFLGTGVEPDTEEKIRHHPEVLEWVPELARFQRGRGFWEYRQTVPDSVAVSLGLAELLGKTKVLDDFPLPVPGTPVAPASVLDCRAPDAFQKIASDTNVQLAARTFSGDFAAADADIASHYSVGLALAEDTGLVAPLSMLQRLYDTDGITYLAVYLKTGTGVGRFLRRIQGKIRAAGLDFDVYPFDDERISLFYVGVINFLLVMAGFFVFLVFGVVALSIINSMTMSILERTREIGTLRSIGFRPQFISGLFVREAAALTGLSLLAGGAISAIVSAWVNSLNWRFRPPGISGTMQFVLKPNLALGLTLAIPILLITVFTARTVTLRKTRLKTVELMTSGNS